jgi:hypothetical protein
VSGKPTYENDTCEELLDLSRANAQAVIIATAAFLERSGVSVDAWAHALGETFAGSWDADLALSAGEFLDAMLTNYRSLGAEVLSASLDDDYATATIAGFPKPELCRELRIDCASAERYFGVPETLAAAHSLRWTWSVDGPRARLEVSRIDRG